MKIYNTLTRKKEEFQPLEEGKVKMYVCGPTVYNLIHIGNARPMICFDTVRRYLEYKGYDVNYVSNFTDVDDKIIKKANELGFNTIADGKNSDDGKVYRPGAEAARELGIVSPLYETGMTKQDIRQAARELGLETWNKPSNSCLATRFPYDTERTAENFAKVEGAELLISQKGIPSGRVRMHGDIARIEVPEDRFNELISDRKLIEDIKNFGFRYVTLDLEGFRSGSMD